MKTVKGRVVYNRKPHYFNRKDLVRINSRAGIEIWEIPLLNAEVFFERLKAEFQAVAAELRGDAQSAIETIGDTFIPSTSRKRPEGNPQGLLFVVEE